MTAGGRQATWLSEGDDAGVSKLAAKAQYGKPAEGSASFRRTLVGDNLQAAGDGSFRGGHGSCIACCGTSRWPRPVPPSAPILGMACFQPPSAAVQRSRPTASVM